MKTSFTTLIGAAALVIGSVAVAQSTAGAPPPTSTAGNGCTATSNAMKGGNLGGQASPGACDEKAVNAAAVAPGASTRSASGGTTSGAAMGSSGEPVRKAPMRVARADRN